MDFLKLAHVRYSVRAYRPDSVPEAILQQILDAARMAPTAANRQAFRLIVVHTAGREQELKRIYCRDWFVQPPLIIGICAIAADAWKRSTDGKNYGDVDATIAMDHLIMAAADLGLGTCWIAAFDPKAAREILHIPEGIEPVAFTPLGFPADKPGLKKRQPIENLVLYESWPHP